MSGSIETIMTLVDQVTPGLQQIREQLAATAQSANSTGNALNNVGGAGGGGGAGGAGGFLRSLGAAAGVATIALGALTIAAGAAYGVLSTLNEAGKAGIEFGDAISDIAGKAGITAEELQKLRIVAETNGGSFEAVDKSLIKFNQNLGLAQQGTGALKTVLDRLNISLYTQDGLLKDTPTLYREVAAGIGSIENPAQQSALAVQAFGKSGAELVESMSMSKEATEEARAKAVEYGAVMSNEMVNAAAAAKDEITLVDQGTASLNAQLQLAIGLPVAKWWAGVTNWIAQTSVEFAKFLGLMDQFNTTKLEADLDKAGRRVAIFQEGLDKANKKLASGEENKGLFGWFQPDPKESVDYFTKMVAKETAKRDAIAKQIESLKQAPEAKATEAPEAVDTEKGLKALDAYRLKVEADRAANLTDAKAKANALYQVEIQRLQNELVAIQENSELSTESKNKAFDLYTEHTKNAQDKLNNDLKAIDDKAAKEKTAADKKAFDAQAKADKEWLDAAVKKEEFETKQKDAFAAILTKYDEQAAKQNAIVTGTEKQLELKNALLDAEKALGRELSSSEAAQVTAAVEGKQRTDAQLKQFNDLKTAAEKNAAQIEDIYKNAAQSIQGAFSDFFFDVMQGNLSDLAGSFKRTIDRMVADLLAAKLFQAVGGIGNGTAAGGGLSGLFSGVFSGISGRAVGGPVSSGTPYWVGEKGPEIIVPGINSTVIPADVSEAMTSGASAGGGQYHISINAVDSKSFMDMVENNDRDLVNAITKASQFYGIK